MVVVGERVVGIGAAPAVAGAQAEQRVERSERARAAVGPRRSGVGPDRPGPRPAPWSCAARRRGPGPAASVPARSAFAPGSRRCAVSRASAAARPTNPSGHPASAMGYARMVSGPVAAVGDGVDALDEALAVDADQSSGDRDDRSGAAVVRGQLNAPRAGVERLEARGFDARRRAARHRWSGRRRRPRTGCAAARPAGATRRSCAASTSWNSSTHRCVKRSCQRTRRRGSDSSASAAPTTRSSKSTAPVEASMAR